MNKIQSLFQSRRFYAAVAGLLFVFTDGLGIPIAQTHLTEIVLLVVTWIAGDTFRKTE